MRTEGGRQYLFVAIDCTSKLAFAELHREATAVQRLLPATGSWRCCNCPQKAVAA
ncbi:hypothetical protein [Hymenobacter coccineus]|uniref:hypothetical protein n=1 Tax=Hymenobacter coccineus TaxID=1908235 RepID=UPI001300D749|nr:hypothetical protein [Hymenobacter coccineus]